MKKLFLTIMVLLVVLLTYCYGGMLIGSGYIPPAGGGFVGTKNGSLTDSTESAARASFYSDFTATAGDVSYMYLDIGADLSVLTNLRLSIHDSSGNFLEGTSCTLTNISGTLFRAQLDSTYTLSAITYRLVFTIGQSWTDDLYVSATAGTAYGGTAYLWIECPPDARISTITESSTVSASYAFSIWASNSDGDTHE